LRISSSRFTGNISRAISAICENPGQPSGLQLSGF
jgi:hypothetical protein